MPRVDIVIDSEVSQTARARQLEGIFDVPSKKTQRLEWHADIPIEDQEWNVGLIVGPSGSGKSTTARELFGKDFDTPLEWQGNGVIDDFPEAASMREISEVCQAVGFNTIPAWLRPYDVLSTGEKFRVEIARRLVECPDPIVMDEFTSVVDRQVAKIGSYAVAKYVRRYARRFVAVSCHYDIIDWLQPDWLFEPATATFAWRSVQPRPKFRITIGRVPRAAWRLFAPFHYMTKGIHNAVRCYGLWCDGRLAAFLAMLHRQTSSGTCTYGGSRIVVLPDWQGLGLAGVLIDRVAALYKAVGRRVTVPPGHPSWIRRFDRSPFWHMTKKPGRFGTQKHKGRKRTLQRPSAWFEYAGPAHRDIAFAESLITTPDRALSPV